MEKKILLTKCSIIIQYINILKTQNNHLFKNNMKIMNTSKLVNYDVVQGINYQFNSFIERLDCWWSSVHTINDNIMPIV